MELSRRGGRIFQILGLIEFWLIFLFILTIIKSDIAFFIFIFVLLSMLASYMQSPHKLHLVASKGTLKRILGPFIQEAWE